MGYGHWSIYKINENYKLDNSCFNYYLINFILGMHIMSYLKMRSSIAKAKNLGSSKSGHHHWWHQRLTSIFMVPLTIWNIFILACIVKKDMAESIELLSSPLTIVPLILFIIIAFYHASLGMRVVIEDYISCLYIRYTLIITIQFFCLVTVASAILALLSLITL